MFSGSNTRVCSGASGPVALSARNKPALVGEAVFFGHGVTGAAYLRWGVFCAGHRRSAKSLACQAFSPPTAIGPRVFWRKRVPTQTLGFHEIDAAARIAPDDVNTTRDGLQMCGVAATRVFTKMVYLMPAGNLAAHQLVHGSVNVDQFSVFTKLPVPGAGFPVWPYPAFQRRVRAAMRRKLRKACFCFHGAQVHTNFRPVKRGVP